MALDDLIRYEGAAVAGIKAKENPMIALTAMNDFYKTIGMEEDYFVQEGLSKTQESLIRAANAGRDLTLENTGLLEAIAIYNDKYNKSFTKEKISGLVSYLEGSCSLPEQAKKGLLEYKDLTYKELADMSKSEKLTDEDKKKIKNALTLILQLKELKLEKSYIKMRTKGVESAAKELYPEPKKS